MKIFFPVTGTELQWNAAYCRLESYLCALQVVNKVHQNQIILRLLEAAAIKHAANPELCPTSLAMGEIRTAMDHWFAQIMPLQERVSIVGKLALLANSVPEKWPASFLNDEIPADLPKVFNSREWRAVPALQVSSMVPQPFTNPLLGDFNLSQPVEKIAESLSPLVEKGTALVMSAFTINTDHPTK